MTKGILWDVQAIIMIRQWEEGDGYRLAELLDSEEELPTLLRQYIAKIVRGELPAPVRKKITWRVRTFRYARERAVAHEVSQRMDELGRQRDKKLRTLLLREFAPLHGTTAAAVERFLRLPKARRQPKHYLSRKS